MRVEALARVLSKNDETVAADAIYKLAIDQFPISHLCRCRWPRNW
jgi:hypothetical protein